MKTKMILRVSLFFLLAWSVISIHAGTPIYKQAKYSTDERVTDLLSQMTIDEKIAQIRHLTSWNIFNGQELDMEKLSNITDGIAWGFVDGFPLTGESMRINMRAVQKHMIENTRLSIPIFTVGESLHGSAHEGSTIFPQNIALGSTFNTKLAYARAEMTTRDLHAQGLKQVLAPCIDVVRDMRWGRVEESYGEDPFLNGKMAIAEVNGYINNGIAPMLKHYGAHGNPLGGLNLASVECGVRDLLDVYLKPFEMVVKETPIMAVMSSYNSWNRVPNSASHYLMTEILREDWGFQGYVYSDWGAIQMLEAFHHTARNKQEGAFQALTAGLDVEASSDSYPTIKEMVAEGKLDIKVVDTAVARVLRAKFEAGLFEDPYGEKYANHKMHTSESITLSRKIADESTVLLKNKNNLLPLDKSKIKSIAVLGPNANQVQFGDYTWSRDNRDGVTPLAGLKNLLGNNVKINYAQGASMMTLDTAMIPEAVEAAKKSDVAVIFCGSSSASLARDYSSTNCGEGFDLHDLHLTGAQGELIKAVHATGKPVVLVLVSGKPFAIEWEQENIPAIVAQWYAGEQCGASIADILFGNVNPSGKLTYSFPRSAGHLPAYYNHLPSDKGYYKQHGSYEKSGRDYVFSSPTTLWNFGHGLSYTKFSMTNFSTDKKNYNEQDSIKVSLEIENIGEKSGQEVIQVYVRDVISSVVTPVKSLKAFSKINLQAKETKDVTLSIPVSELYIRDLDNQKVIEAGDFEIQVGNASDNIIWKTTIYVGDVSSTSSEMKIKDTKRIAGKNMKVNGTIRDIQATLVFDVTIHSTLLNKEVGKTNNKGTYSIDVPENDILVFKKKGYTTSEVEVNKQSNISISLSYE